MLVVGAIITIALLSCVKIHNYIMVLRVKNITYVYHNDSNFNFASYHQIVMQFTIFNAIRKIAVQIMNINDPSSDSCGTTYHTGKKLNLTKSYGKSIRTRMKSNFGEMLPKPKIQSVRSLGKVQLPFCNQYRKIRFVLGKTKSSKSKIFFINGFAIALTKSKKRFPYTRISGSAHILSQIFQGPS